MPARILACLALAACGGGGGDPVDAGGDATAPPDAYVDHAGPLFAPDHLAEVSITLAAADWEALRAQSRTIGSVIEGDCLAGPAPSPFLTYHASITVDGTTLPDVGIKKKGFFGSLDPHKPSLKVKLDEYVPGSDYLGLEKLTLNNAHQDPAYVRQCMAYNAFAAAGVVAPRCNYAHVRVNSEDLGLYVNVETIDHRLMKQHFSDGTGPLYEGALSDFRTGWVSTFDAKGDGDRTDLAPIVTAVETASDGDLVETLGAVVDLDELFTYWAMEVLTGQWDGYANNKNNFFVYHDPSSGQVQLIPWGVDGTFQPGHTFGGLSSTDGPVAVAAAGVITNRLFQLPDQRERLWQRERELLDQVWNEPGLLAEIDRMETLVTPVADPYAGPGWHGAVDRVRAFVSGRRAEILAALDAGPTWDEPLAGYPCLDIRGRLDAAFETTWGTIGAPNPLTTGSGTMTLTLTIDGIPTVLSPVGATSGLDPNPPAGQTATAMIQIFGVRVSDGHIIVISTSTPPLIFVPRIADLGFFDSFGVAYDYDPATSTAGVIGFMLGELALEQASTTGGAPIRGSVHANADQQGTGPPRLRISSLHELAVLAAREARARAARRR